MDMGINRDLVNSKAGHITEARKQGKPSLYMKSFDRDRQSTELVWTTTVATAIYRQSIHRPLVKPNSPRQGLIDTGAVPQLSLWPLVDYQWHTQPRALAWWWLRFREKVSFRLFSESGETRFQPSTSQEQWDHPRPVVKRHSLQQWKRQLSFVLCLFITGLVHPLLKLSFIRSSRSL